MALINFCTLPWWLLWLLPFLLGILVGWGIWSKYKDQVKSLQKDIKDLNEKINALENDLSHCRKRRAELESELALTKGRIRELEASIREAQEKIPPRAQGSGFIPDVTQSLSSSPPEPEAKIQGPGVENYPLTVFKAFKNDNLQVIEGVGPKMEEVLKENGLHSWSDLSNQTSESLRDILDKYGDKYRIIEPGTWPEQAALAKEGKWYELVDQQKKLNAGRTDAKGLSNSKIEKLLVKLGLVKIFTTNDLKAIEGIGPKIETLLQSAGIDSWRKLAGTSSDTIKEILNKGGSNFSLADPETWPKQAGLAADGKWKELFELQDILKGGKFQ